jgi:serine/threonine-protein kinase
MSPEQADGQLDRLGPRSDVYSLGATLYCLLMGIPPFEGDVFDVIRAVQRGEFRPPRLLDSAIDGALEAVCLKAMALKPEDRYSSCRALAEDIERWMADEPVAAWREPWTRRARRWERRHRTAVMAGTSAVLVALAGMFSVLVVQARANSELTRSNNALAAANERERFNLAMDAVGLFHGEVSEDLLLKEKPFAALRTNLLRGAAGFYSKLEGLLAGQTDRPSRAALARAYDELAELSEKIGSEPEALAVRRKALAVHGELAMAPEADVATRADVARSWIAVGSLQQATGDPAGALASYEEARRLAAQWETTAGADEQRDAVLGLVHQQMGKVLLNIGTLAEALASYERALEIRRKLANSHPDLLQPQSELAQTYFEFGDMLRLTGRPAEALEASERALEIRRKLADAHPGLLQCQNDLAQSHRELGYMLHLTGRSDEALAALRTSLEIRRKLVEANPNLTEFQFQLARCHDFMGWVYRQTGKPAEALAAFERAITILSRLADDHPTVIVFARSLAVCYVHTGGIHREAGRPLEAAADTRRAVSLLERLPALESIDRYNLACGHARLAGIAALPRSGMSAAEGRVEAKRAMQWLHGAVAGGYRNVAIMQKDQDLDPLRSRPDFRLLMMDLEFPDDPFARGD